MSRRAPNVTIEDLEVAAEWLESYEPSDDEADRAVALALSRVAKKLLKEASFRRVENLRREVSRKVGRNVPLAKVREFANNA